MKKRDDFSIQVDRNEKKDRVLTRGTPSVTPSIADAIVTKEGDVFFLAKPDGMIPLKKEHGLGLYYHDCRFLRGYEIRLNHTKPAVLVSTTIRGYEAVFELTNHDLKMSSGALIPKETIGIHWLRKIESTIPCLNETFTFKNYKLKTCAFEFSLTFQPGFEDVYTVRSLLDERLGTQNPYRWINNKLAYEYEGADGILRTLTIEFRPKPQAKNGESAVYRLALKSGKAQAINIRLILAEKNSKTKASQRSPVRHSKKSVRTPSNSSHETANPARVRILTEERTLDVILDRSYNDLQMLRSSLNGNQYYAAGIPWFATLFGRDSIITALEMMAYTPEEAAETLRLLAFFQGKKVDEWKDEQPGKILHEIRRGELANLEEIPHNPYYGTVDATPLFLILLGEYVSWTGDLQLFVDLKSNVLLALEWMDKFGDSDGDGFIEYKSASEKGLINQGWKDSGDAIIQSNGSLGIPPIALVEVQAYAYSARLRIAELFDRIGETRIAGGLRTEARVLRKKFNKLFWMPDLNFYTLALETNKKPLRVISSNPGHALWAGIADQEKARKSVRRLMQKDMFAGWGVRTLSEKEKAYNPIGYHLGTVWFHDNAIIGAGFRRYGFDKEAQQIFNGVLEAALHFQNYQLPELISGFSKKDFPVPVHFPVACHPQAWAAGSIPFLLTSFLGLLPEALDHRLRVIRPILPEFVDWIQIQGLRIGDAQLDMKFERRANQNISVRTSSLQGKLEVIIQDT